VRLPLSTIRTKVSIADSLFMRRVLLHFSK
jgi:hypothetical protein